jgi:thioredoxin 1
MAIEITDSQFKAEIEDHKGLAFVDFWAPWCGPCVMMSPIYDKVSKKYPGIKFAKVNTVANIKKATDLGVTGIPCVIVFKDGKEVERLVGFRPEAGFDAAIKKYL